MNAIRLAPRDTSFEAPDRADSSFVDYASSLIYDALYHSPVSGTYRLSEASSERNAGGGFTDALAYSIWGIDNRETKPKISAQEASKTYGLEGELTFDSPVYESYAQLLQDRKLAEHRREFELQSRSEKHWSRGISGFGVSLVAQALDPVNLASMFIPIVGEERMLSGAKHAGSFLQRGLMSPKTVVGFTGNNRFAYRAAKGAISGIAGAAMVEPFNLLAALDEQANYDFKDSAMNLLFSGILGAGIPSVGGHFADKFRAAHLAVRELDPQTHESAVMGAVSDLVQDKPVTSPADLISVDHTVVTRELQSTNSRNILSIAEEHLNRLEELYLQGRTTPEMEARRKLIGGILRNPNSATIENLAAMFNLKIDEAVAAVPEIFRHVDPETYKKLPKEIQDLINTDRGSQPGATTPGDIGLVPMKGGLGKKGWHTTTDSRYRLSVVIDQDGILLNNIEAVDQGKGAGTEMLNKLKMLSNSIGKDIKLIAAALDEANQARLEKFYENLGFQKTGKGTEYIYKSKSQPSPAQVTPAQVREATVKKVKEIATKKANPRNTPEQGNIIDTPPVKAEPIKNNLTNKERKQEQARLQEELDSMEQDMNLTPEEKGTFDEVVDAIEKWSTKQLNEGRKKTNMAGLGAVDPVQAAAGIGYMGSKAIKLTKGLVTKLAEDISLKVTFSSLESIQFEYLDINNKFAGHLDINYVEELGGIWTVDTHNLSNHIRGRKLGRQVIQRLADHFGVIGSSHSFNKIAEKMWKDIGAVFVDTSETIGSETNGYWRLEGRKLDPEVAQEAALKLVSKEIKSKEIKVDNNQIPKQKFVSSDYASLKDKIMKVGQKIDDFNRVDEEEVFMHQILQENEKTFIKSLKILLKEGYDVLNPNNEVKMGGEAIVVLTKEHAIKFFTDEMPKIDIKGFINPALFSKEGDWKIQVSKRVTPLADIQENLRIGNGKDISDALDLYGYENNIGFWDIKPDNLGIDEKGNLLLIDSGAVDTAWSTGKKAEQQFKELWKKASPEAKKIYEKIKSQIEEAHKIAQENIEAKQLDKAKKGLEAGINCITKKII